MNMKLIISVSLISLLVLIAVWLYARNFGPQPTGPQAAGINDMGGPTPLDAAKSSEIESSNKVWEGSTAAPENAASTDTAANGS